MGNKDIWYGECKIAFTSDDWKRKGYVHSLKFLEKINTDNMPMYEHEALILTPEQQELDALYNYKIAKDGTADFIDSYIPVKKNTGGYFTGTTINNRIQIKNGGQEENHKPPAPS